jgi:hypothetical protein
VGGVFGGEVDVDLAPLLKKRDADFFGGGGCGSETRVCGYDGRRPWGERQFMEKYDAK